MMVLQVILEERDPLGRRDTRVYQEHKDRLDIPGPVESRAQME